MYHYEYALMNFDFERAVRRFAVPVSPGQTVTNAAFGDGNGDLLDDWTVTIGSSEVAFDAPAGAELDWGRLVNFRFDVDAPPVASHAELEPLAAGGPSSVTIAALAPTALAVPVAPAWALGALIAGVAGAGIALARERTRA